MTMKRKTIFLLPLYLYACGQPVTLLKNTPSPDSLVEKKYPVTNALNIDTANIAIIPYDSLLLLGYTNLKGIPASLTPTDSRAIDSLLALAISEYNQKHDTRYAIIHLEKYKRQYIAMTNQKGEKVVWANFFCSTHGADWKHVMIGVDDGGNCYFQVTFNLSQRKYERFSVNGTG